jgi:hypothetical protein
MGYRRKSCDEKLHEMNKNPSLIKQWKVCLFVLCNSKFTVERTMSGFCTRDLFPRKTDPPQNDKHSLPQPKRIPFNAVKIFDALNNIKFSLEGALKAETVLFD